MTHLRELEPHSAEQQHHHGDDVHVALKPGAFGVPVQVVSLLRHETLRTDLKQARLIHLLLLNVKNENVKDDGKSLLFTKHSSLEEKKKVRRLFVT